MSLGFRLRSERLRLGANQTDFAALAGASKGAQINWEKDVNSPPASALSAWALRAGVDALYVLTGRRTFDVPLNSAAAIEAQLAGIRRDILEPSFALLPGENSDQAEKRVLEWHSNTLSSIFNHDFQLVSPEVAEEITHLLDVVTNPASRALYRAADFAQRRARRRQIKEEIAGWFDSPPYRDTVANLLTTLASDYAVPIKLLVELVEELRDDIANGLAEPQQS